MGFQKRLEWAPRRDRMSFMVADRGDAPQQFAAPHQSLGVAQFVDGDDAAFQYDQPAAIRLCVDNGTMSPDQARELAVWLLEAAVRAELSVELEVLRRKAESRLMGHPSVTPL